MSNGRILVAADSPENASQLKALLASGGYSVIQADPSTAPPDADILLADITRTRFSPYADIQALRRQGCPAPGIVLAAHITDQMATEAFSLNIRDFVLRPIDDAALLERISHFIAAIRAATQTAQPRSELPSELESQAAPTDASLIARRLEEMNMLSRIGRAISSLADLDKMLAHVVDAAAFLTKAEEGAIFLLDHQGGLLLGAEKGFGARQAEVIKRPSKDSDAMEVVRTGTPIKRGAETETKLITDYLVRASINVPIIIGKQTAGVLAVYNHGQRSFEEADLALLTNLADYAAMSIDKVRSLQQVEQQMRDALGASREVVLHAETLTAPVQGIESLADTLLQGDFGPLSEQQYAAVRRIKQATARLNEVVDLINQAVAVAPALRAAK